MPRQEDTRDRLFALALEGFAQRGFSGVSIRELCAGAGIRESSFYNHYPSKRALLDRAIEEMTAYMHSPRLVEFQPVRWASRDLRALLLEGLDLFLEAWSKPALRQLWMALSHEQYADPAVARLMNQAQADRIAATARMFRFLVRKGRMRQGPTQALAVAYVHALSSMKLEHVLRVHHSLEPESHARLMRRQVEAFARQWAPDPGGP